MLRLAHEVQQVLELGLGLAGEAGDEGRADHDLGAGLAPALQRSRLRSPLAGRFMRLSTSGCECWKGTSR
jgi:hypothetical protein